MSCCSFCNVNMTQLHCTRNASFLISSLYSKSIFNTGTCSTMHQLTQTGCLTQGLLFLSYPIYWLTQNTVCMKDISGPFSFMWTVHVQHHSSIYSVMTYCQLWKFLVCSVSCWTIVHFIQRWFTVNIINIWSVQFYVDSACIETWFILICGDLLSALETPGLFSFILTVCVQYYSTFYTVMTYGQQQKYLVCSVLYWQHLYWTMVHFNLWWLTLNIKNTLSVQLHTDSVCTVL